MSKIKEEVNAVKSESIGDANIKFEEINGQWMVSSLEIHRVFKSGTTTKHANMVRYFQNRKGCEGDWEECLTGGKITTSEYKDASGKLNTYYYFNKDAFLFYVMSMDSSKSSEFRWAFINKYNELEKLAMRVATGERELGPNASKLLSNIAFSHEVIELGAFCKILSNNNKGLLIGRNKLYQLLRDMEFVAKDENRHLNKADSYLDTKISPKGHTYVVVYTSAIQTLTEIIREFASNHKDRYSMFLSTYARESLEDHLESDHKFTKKDVERSFYSKHHVYEQMLRAKDDMVEVTVQSLLDRGFVGEYEIDLNENFMGDGYMDATYDKPTLKVKVDKHGNTTVWND